MHHEDKRPAVVALVKCQTYDYQQVILAVERGLELLGGVETLVKPWEKILLKPNLLAPETAEKCVTTHPVVFRAVAEKLQKAGGALTYGDSPGIGSPEWSARKSGIMEVAQELEIPLVDFKQGQEIAFPGGQQNKKFTIARGVLESEGLISLSKLKTHGLTRMTGAIKNQFGCIPGLLKGEFHVKLPDPENFSRMLVDLNLLLRPRLYVMDGIMAMEGNGPRGGTPIPMGVLLFSTDPVALDATVCRMVNLSPEIVPTIRLGQAMGLGTYTHIDLVGDSLAEFIQPDYKVPRTEAMSVRNPWLRNQLVPRPVIKDEECIRCGICVGACPVVPPVVNWRDDDHASPPGYDYNRCIRCYCCQEMCPESAITIETPWLGRVFAFLRG